VPRYTERLLRNIRARGIDPVTATVFAFANTGRAEHDGHVFDAGEAEQGRVREQLLRVFEELRGLGAGGADILRRRTRQGRPRDGKRKFTPLPEVSASRYDWAEAAGRWHRWREWSDPAARIHPRDVISAYCDMIVQSGLLFGDYLLLERCCRSDCGYWFLQQTSRHERYCSPACRRLLEREQIRRRVRHHRRRHGTR
jgi:hypothetical protein